MTIRRTAALALLSLVLLRSTGPGVLSVLCAPGQTQALTFTVTVKDKFGRSVMGLEAKDFAVFDDNRKLDITTLAVDKVPCSIGVIIDVSGSMQNPTRSHQNIAEILQPALSRFFQVCGQANQYFAIAFAKEVNLISDWTGDRTAIPNKIRQVKTKGASPIFDACYTGIEKVLGGPNLKRVIILVSDGMDTDSMHSGSDVTDLLADHDILFYYIRTSYAMQPYDRYSPPEDRTLEHLAKLSGGATLYADSPDAVKSALVQIAVELQAQYVIEATAPSPTGKRAWHKLRVILNQSKGVPKALQPLAVQFRQGYYEQ